MIVLDASLVVELLMDSALAGPLRRGLALDAESYIVPHLLDIEVTSALRQSSKEFRAWWSTHDVILPIERSKVLRHPKAGRLTLHLSILQVFRSPHLKLFSFTPVEGTDTAQRLVSLLGR